MERWTKDSTLVLQDLNVRQWHKVANLKPLEERFGNTCDMSQKVLKGKSVATDTVYETLPENNSAECKQGKSSVATWKCVKAAKIKVLEEIHFSADGWQMIMKTCSSLLCRLQPPHPWHCWQRLTAAFISSSAFFVCFSDTAPGILQHSPPRLQRIWNNFPLSMHMLNSDSPTIPPTPSLENLRITVWLRACREKVLAFTSSHHWLSDISCLRKRFSTQWRQDFVYARQMRTIIYMRCLSSKI